MWQTLITVLTPMLIIYAVGLVIIVVLYEILYPSRGGNGRINSRDLERNEKTEA